jgi:hypothetical protein
MNVTRKWKRFLAVGCSHGHLADQALLRQKKAEIGKFRTTTSGGKTLITKHYRIA